MQKKKNQIKTVTAAFNAGVKAKLRGQPITAYKGNNKWYKKQWQSGWNSIYESYIVKKEIVNTFKPVSFWTKLKNLILKKESVLLALFLLICIGVSFRERIVVETIVKTVEVEVIKNVCTASKTPNLLPTITQTMVPTPYVEPTKISDKGIEFLLHYEGFFGSLQDDVPGGNCTIGYGHLVHMQPCNGDASESPWDRGITKANALKLFKSDLAIFEEGVVELVTVPLNQCQFDALVSFSFNVGLGKLKGNKPTDILLTELNKGNYDIVPTELNKYIWSSGYWWEGLKKRRAAEGKMFSSCQY
jgi:lysozyme